MYVQTKKARKINSSVPNCLWVFVHQFISFLAPFYDRCCSISYQLTINANKTLIYNILKPQRTYIAIL